MKETLAVFVGGGIGSLLRYGMTRWLINYEKTFPVATLSVNLTSCLVLGVLIVLLETRFAESSVLRHLLVAGFCGGFSTFSTLVRENYVLFERGMPGEAVLYSVVSVVGGLLLLLIGIWIGKIMFTRV